MNLQQDHSRINKIDSTIRFCLGGIGNCLPLFGEYSSPRGDAGSVQHQQITLNDASLGSRVDEERCQLRQLSRLADSGEMTSLRMHFAVELPRPCISECSCKKLFIKHIDLSLCLDLFLNRAFMDQEWPMLHAYSGMKSRAFCDTLRN